MTRQEPGASSAGGSLEYEVDHRLARRSPGGLWWLALLLIPLLLAALLSFFKGPDIESDLKNRATDALEAKGFEGVAVSFDGRDGTLTVPEGVDANAALDVVEDVTGVRVATIGDDAAMGDGDTDATETPAAPEPTTIDKNNAACDNIQKNLEAALAGQVILFAESSAAISPESQATIAKGAEVLKACNTAKILVGGHTDNQGNQATSGPLSQARADAVKNALVALGIAADRVTAQGFGESQPIADNTTDAGQAQNRRISIQVQ